MTEAGEFRLIISAKADADTDDIAFYFSLQNEEISHRFPQALQETYLFLMENPGVGRQRTTSGSKVVRQWPVRGFTNYLIFYQPLGDGIRVVRVLHGARNLPEFL